MSSSDTSNGFIKLRPLTFEERFRLQARRHGLEQTLDWFIRGVLAVGALREAMQRRMPAFFDGGGIDEFDDPGRDDRLRLIFSRFNTIRKKQDEQAAVFALIANVAEALGENPEDARRFIEASGLTIEKILNAFNAELNTKRDLSLQWQPIDTPGRLAGWLCRMGILDVDSLLRMSDLSPSESCTSLLRVKRDWKPEQKRDIHTLGFWLLVEPSACRGFIERALADTDEAVIVDRFLAVCEQLILAKMTALVHWNSHPAELLDIERFVFDHVYKRIAVRMREAEPALRLVWLEFASEVYYRGGIDRIEFPRAEIIAAADYELGTLRKELRAASRMTQEQRSGCLRRIDACSRVFFEIGDLWSGMKLLLLLLRALDEPAVLPDLRDEKISDEPDDGGLPPWRGLMSCLIYGFHGSVAREQEQDPDLHELRSRFAHYCLEHLRSRKDNGGPREPNAIWRRGYIKAAVSLRVNPYGKGHHILNHVREHDPDPGVRAEAKAAYAKLRNGPKLPKGRSPRRYVLEAIWWLRQAHRLALGLDIDEIGANAMREEEIRRTTQSTKEKTQQVSEDRAAEPSSP